MKPKRIHIINDNSTDKTLQRIHETIRMIDSEAEIVSEEKTTINGCEIHITVIRSRRLGIDFIVYDNNGKPIGKGGFENWLVLSGRIHSEYFLNLDADTVVDEYFAEKSLRILESDKNIVAVFGYLFSKAEENGIIPKLYEYGRDISYRMSYVIFRYSSNKLGFHYGLSGPRVMFRTKTYMEIPRPLDNHAGDTAHAWELQAKGYKIYTLIDTYGVTREPSTIRGFWKQRVKWHSGPYENLYLRGKKVLSQLWRQSKKRFLAGLYTIMYYVFLSTIYQIKWGIVFPLLALFGIIPLFAVQWFYTIDFTAFMLASLFSTLVLRRYYEEYRREKPHQFIKRFIAFYFWFRPQITLIIVYSLTRVLKDILLSKINGHRISWIHYT